MAYAGIAGMLPETGLYAAPLAMVAYAIFGTARHLNVGPSSAVAALSFSVIIGLVAACDCKSQAETGNILGTPERALACFPSQPPDAIRQVWTKRQHQQKICMILHAASIQMKRAFYLDLQMDETKTNPSVGMVFVWPKCSRKGAKFFSWRLRVFARVSVPLLEMRTIPRNS
ncbi:MAG: hypothetical protein HF973_16560 [Chloroflexi bacterium]|nr:hypothetical protein [Chloroflexota bacterium]